MKCKDCWWWVCAGKDLAGKPYDFGNCHKCIPKIFQLTEDVSKGYEAYSTVVTSRHITRWPQTKEDDFCGEFKPKESEKNHE